MIKGFIFDMDGVIIDSQPMHFDVDIGVMQYFGVNIKKEDLEEYVGMANEEIWGLIKEKYNMKQTLSEIIEYQLSRKIQAFKDIQTDPIEGIRELINKLYALGIPIAVASSSPKVIIEEVLNKFKITNYFSYIISGEEVTRSKPAPDIYLEAARMMNVHPNDCVVLEDSKNGIIAAKEAGMKCIGYYNPNSGNQDLSRADLVIKRMNDIIIDSL